MPTRGGLQSQQGAHQSTSQFRQSKRDEVILVGARSPTRPAAQVEDSTSFQSSCIHAIGSGPDISTGAFSGQVPSANESKVRFGAPARPMLVTLQPETVFLAPPRAGPPLPDAAAVCGPPIYRQGLGPPARLAAGIAALPRRGPLSTMPESGISVSPMFSTAGATRIGSSLDVVVPRFFSEPNSSGYNSPLMAPRGVDAPVCLTTAAKEREAQHISFLEAVSSLHGDAKKTATAADAGSEPILADEAMATRSGCANARPNLAVPDAKSSPLLGAEKVSPEVIAKWRAILADLPESPSSGASAKLALIVPESSSAPHADNPQAAPDVGEDEAALLDATAVPALPSSPEIEPIDGIPDIEPGDSVILGQGAPPEYRRSPAVVMKVSEAHCTVIVLDKSLRYGVGECWPMLEDVLPIQSRDWRAGAQVIISGLRGGKVRKLNGFTGTIVAHPREGHPSFIERPPKPKSGVIDCGPQLVLCVRLDDPIAAGQKTVLLEPRFLVPRGQSTRDELGGSRAPLRGRAMSCPATDERASDEEEDDSRGNGPTARERADSGHAARERVAM